MKEKRRRRRNSRNRFRKPDAVIVTLSSMVILLLLVWGVAAGTKSHHEWMNEPPAAIRDTVSPAERTNDQTDEPEAVTSPKAAEATTSPKATEATTSPKATEAAASPKATEAAASPKAAESAEQVQYRYEQDILQVKAVCMVGMNEVLNDAESQIRQLDLTDPSAVKNFQENENQKLAEAESSCNGDFYKVTLKAEKDAVSPAKIEYWKQTFDALKEKLYRESKANLQQMMGG